MRCTQPGGSIRLGFSAFTSTGTEIVHYVPKDLDWAGEIELTADVPQAKTIRYSYVLPGCQDYRLFSWFLLIALVLKYFVPY